MANAKQASAKRMKMAERARHLKALHFPEVHDDFLWHRSQNDGYTTIPRSMPIVMEAIDAMTKGHPAAQTLLTLWCRAPDHALLTIESPSVLAAEAGFSGERQVDTWRRRMKQLVELGFIAVKPGAAGDFHYVLLLNPNWAIEIRRWRNKDVPESIYAKFVERLMDIGAYSEIEVIRSHIARWESEAAAAAAVANASAEAVPAVVAEASSAVQEAAEMGEASVPNPPMPESVAPTEKEN